MPIKHAWKLNLVQYYVFTGNKTHPENIIWGWWFANLGDKSIEGKSNITAKDLNQHPENVNWKSC